MKRCLLPAALGAALVMSPSLVYAHVGVGSTHGFTSGCLHPLLGLDHVLAMVSVGIIAYQLGGRAVWVAPATFLALMAAGGALGIRGGGIPVEELGIALSVVVLGAAVAFNMRVPLALVLASVGLFAIFHGYAHGREMPDGTSGLAYGVGFLIAAGALHLAGISLGLLIGRLGETGRALWVRRVGGAIALTGIVLVAGAL
ncbi:HupE/UreJ family protein [Xanthobacter sp. AM11]|uniref:HupE/UreJ family protein n=1 Tax=Xanthobacter sp. AM11 TaxID=3380643 RepID=UPI0039BFD754